MTFFWVKVKVKVNYTQSLQLQLLLSYWKYHWSLPSYFGLLLYVYFWYNCDRFLYSIKVTLCNLCFLDYACCMLLLIIFRLHPIIFECIKYRLLLLMIAVSVCQSVCHTAQLSFSTVQKWLNGSRCWLGCTLAGAKEHCVRLGSWSPRAREKGFDGEPLPNYVGLLFIFILDHLLC